MHIFQCMGKAFCVEFQRVPLEFHTKYLTPYIERCIFIQHCNFKSSYIEELISVFETPPQIVYIPVKCQQRFVDTVTLRKLIQY